MFVKAKSQTLQGEASTWGIGDVTSNQNSPPGLSDAGVEHGWGWRDSEAGSRRKYKPWGSEERGIMPALIPRSLCYSHWISKELLSTDVL